MKALLLAGVGAFFLAASAHALSSTTHYMYMAVAPSVESPSIPYASGIYVYNIDSNHAYVETIPFPSSAPKVLTIRGIMADRVSSSYIFPIMAAQPFKTQGICSRWI
jgi:hypothetical protein